VAALETSTGEQERRAIWLLGLPTFALVLSFVRRMARAIRTLDGAS
jgi:hypothetical protein